MGTRQVLIGELACVRSASKALSEFAVFGPSLYLTTMASAIIRLVMLLALALMPVGMSGAPAHASAAMTAESGHCGDQQDPADAPAMPKAHCAACAALPAFDLTPAVAELRPSLLLQVEAERWVTEQGPETETPPPKHA